MTNRGMALDETNYVDNINYTFIMGMSFDLTIFRCLGLPDGQYGDTTVRAGRNFTPDGGIAGAYDQMDTGVRNLISRGYAPETVFKMASANPAAYLGIENLGDIRPGMAACMAAWDENWQTRWTMIDGQYFEVQ